MEYEETWKRKIMPSGTPFWEHTASARRTSVSDCGGWPTPKAQRPDQETHYARGNPTLGAVAAMAGRPTPMAGSPGTETYNPAGNTDSSRKTVDLVSAWPTPSARDWKGATNEKWGTNARPLNEVAALASWPTPQSRDGAGSRGGTVDRTGGRRRNLDDYVMLAGWVSPTAEDGRRGNLPPRPHDTGVPLSQQVAGSGLTTTSSPAATEKRGALAPAFSLWLMGFPFSWSECAPSKLLDWRR